MPQLLLRLRGPLEFDALLRTYYGFVEREMVPPFLPSVLVEELKWGLVLSVDGWYRVCSCMCVLGYIHTYLLCITNLISQHSCSPMYSLLIMQHSWLHTVRACYITYASHTAASSDLYAVDEVLYVQNVLQSVAID